MRKERLGGMTHPCPAGQGYAVGVRDRRCLPLRGKSASELARLILVCRGGKQGVGALCPSGTVGRRARKTKHTLLRSMRPPSPRNHPAGGTAGFARTRSRDQSLENPFLGDGGRFPAASPSPERRRRQALARGLAAVCAHSCPKRNESQPVCPLRVEQTGVNSEPTALAAGTAGPAGSARTRSRDQSLENPFLGNRPPFSRSPRPPTPQAAGPCSWACRRLLASPPQPERNAARPPPIRGAGVRQHGAEGAGFRYYRMAAFSAARPET